MKQYMDFVYFGTNDVSNTEMRSLAKELKKMSEDIDKKLLSDPLAYPTPPETPPQSALRKTVSVV